MLHNINIRSSQHSNRFLVAGYAVIQLVLFATSNVPEMGYDHDHHHHVICAKKLSFISISLFFLVISSSWTMQGFVTEEGSRKSLKQIGFQQIVHDDKMLVRARIGSRPPKCEKRCRSCGPCEAIQVPTNPQAHNGKININPYTVSTNAYERGEGNVNYKPMSWKCKCGNHIFNP
ncbi:unnamed protein product [Lupinus luteus]|uniref:Epidermal patterning factor-like protein n=1 Tax=Lupinus luteus TaxID=3873 RepID=A0AAV1WY70_LUPLU